MGNLGTVRELFRHNDWARKHMLERAGGLDDAALDRPFAMGPGSLRATLHHLWGAECVWLLRWRGEDLQTRWDDLNNRAVGLTQLGAWWQATAADRDRYLDGLEARDLLREITYTNLRGEVWTFALGDMLVHLCNHGMHHRAQALNMLRHLGVPPFEPGLDYIFMWRERRGDPPPDVGADSMRDYFTYNAWANERVLEASANLDDAALDRPFEMGEGTLRGTLLHILFAERWWMDNWTVGPEQPFPEMPPRTAFAEIRELSTRNAAARGALLAKLTDEDLRRPIEVRPMPGVVRHFYMSATMLQVCNHGTHHRAQAANMLRHLGATVPPLDYLARLPKK